MCITIGDIIVDYINDRNKAFCNKFVGSAAHHHDIPDYYNSIVLDNVYPALDKNSVYVGKVLKYSKTLADKVFRTILYRMFNRIDFFEYVDNAIKLHYGEFELKEYLVVSHAYTGLKFTDAYFRTSHGKKLVDKTLDAEYISSLLNANIELIIGANSAKELFDRLKGIRHVGGLTAYVITTDLLDYKVFDFDIDEINFVGNGAKKGIEYCLGIKITNNEALEVLNCIYDEIRKYNSIVGIKYMKFNKRCLESAFCEYSKLYRYINNYKVKVRKYKQHTNYTLNLMKEYGTEEVKKLCADIEARRCVLDE